MSDYPADGFSAERLRKLAEIEQSHFWFAGRRILIERFLSEALGTGLSTILDVGCGTGSLTDMPVAGAVRWVVIDRRPEGLTLARSRGPRRSAVRGDAATLPFLRESMDGIFLLDVLEHTDDRKVLAETFRVLKPGGWMILTVPAFAWLWSYRDRAAGHRRRYGRTSLRCILQDSGFEAARMTFYQCFLFPLVVLTRWLGRNGPALRDMEDAPGPLNPVFKFINTREARLSRVFPWPWGSTLAALCWKSHV